MYVCILKYIMTEFPDFLGNYGITIIQNFQFIPMCFPELSTCLLKWKWQWGVFLYLLTSNSTEMCMLIFHQEEPLFRVSSHYPGSSQGIDYRLDKVLKWRFPILFVLCMNLSTIAKNRILYMAFVMSRLTTLLQVWGKKSYLPIWCQNMVGKRAPSPIFDHSQATGHSIKLDNFSIVDRESKGITRTIKEAMYIQVNDPL